MPNYTQNYNLKKPFQEEFYDIDDHNGNMDIIDAVLKALSEKSGVIISPDEPDKGDVWIDTDDEPEDGDGFPVTSVNGKTGDVVLTAQDLDVYTVGQTYSKEEVNKLLPKAYTHPETHPADMITETDTIKMFLATERAKLAGIEEKANRYVHPETHPASMITGLAEHLVTLGFGKIAHGSYVGDGTGYYGTIDDLINRTGTRRPLGVTPVALLLFQKGSDAFCLLTQDDTRVYGYNNRYMALRDSTLYVTSTANSSHMTMIGFRNGGNISGNIYYWIALV